MRDSHVEQQPAVLSMFQSTDVLVPLLNRKKTADWSSRPRFWSRLSACVCDLRKSHVCVCVCVR